MDPDEAANRFREVSETIDAARRIAREFHDSYERFANDADGEAEPVHWLYLEADEQRLLTAAALRILPNLQDIVGTTPMRLTLAEVDELCWRVLHDDWT